MTAGLEGVAGVGLLVGALAVAHQYRPRVWSRLWLLPILGMAMPAAYLLIGMLVQSVPELTDQHATRLQSGPGWLIVRVAGRRHTDCDWQRNEAYVIDAAGNEWSAGVEYIGPGSAGSRKPGVHVFRPRLLQFEAQVQPVAVRFVSHYRCALWLKAVDSGPLWIGDTP